MNSQPLANVELTNSLRYKAVPYLVCHEHELLAVAADLFRRPLGGSVLIGTVLGKIRIVFQSFSQVGLQMPDGSSFLLAMDGPFTASQDFSDFADSRFFCSNFWIVNLSSCFRYGLFLVLLPSLQVSMHALFDQVVVTQS